ncbi:hypothetical protein [Microcoleus sp. FACHB-672]|nr:hypothetical protein [Microcoleus sp. FACHB-672]MBD2039473.1 hypothetical protein [Microcoleus sp. FACHB-672]
MPRLKVRIVGRLDLDESFILTFRWGGGVLGNTEEERECGRGGEGECG